MTSAREQTPQRARLGAALRRLRLDVGLTGPQLAEQIGISQSTVSRLELGQGATSPEVVDRWVVACAAADEQRAELVELAGSVATEATVWRRALRRGLPRLQQEVQELEATAGTLRSLQPVVIPGLLQTAEYARHTVAAKFVASRADVPELIKARLDRQTILFDEAKRFEFVIAEAALRWRLGGPRVMAAQLDRIATVATLGNVEVRVLPLEGEATVWHWHGFDLFDDRADDEPPVVLAGTLTAGLMVSDPHDVALYQETFAAVWEVAIPGEAALAFVGQVAADLRDRSR
ncbi:MAG: helix-turn-helix domain-containing protein [Egibacteraceae bacterium]